MARSGPRALGAFAPPAPPSRPGAARIAVCAASVGLALIVASPVSPGRATGLPTMLSGHARVVDGDTFVVSGERVRLYAVDAPEMAQVCVGTGGRFKCGVAARERALDVVAEVGDVLDCAVERRDRYGRLVGVCRAGGIDVAGVLVDEGLAFAYRAYGMMYVGREELARQQQRYGLLFSAVLSRLCHAVALLSNCGNTDWSILLSRSWDSLHLLA